MPEPDAPSRERLRALNDAFRRSFVGGVVLITAGVEALPAERKRAILAQVRAFAAFDADNDPHGEHDLGVVEDGGVRCLWKLDYYDREMESLSPDPADPALTTRVLTIMLVDEY
jgi:hypothetical protein